MNRVLSLNDDHSSNRQHLVVMNERFVEKDSKPKMTIDFSIDAILRHDSMDDFVDSKEKSKCYTKRKVSRSPRIPFTTYQIACLEDAFVRSRYLSGDDVLRLSRLLNISEHRIKIWFQNRRARLKRQAQERNQTNNDKDTQTSSKQSPNRTDTTSPTTLKMAEQVTIRQFGENSTPITAKEYHYIY